MKKVIVAFILTVAIQHLSLAQTVTPKKSTPKKSLSVKDLNALETEKIKALISISLFVCQKLYKSTPAVLGLTEMILYKVYMLKKLSVSRISCFISGNFCFITITDRK